jgi:hypothetical protein
MLHPLLLPLAVRHPMGTQRSVRPARLTLRFILSSTCLATYAEIVNEFRDLTRKLGASVLIVSIALTRLAPDYIILIPH